MTHSAKTHIHAVVVDDDSNNLETIEAQFVGDYAIDITMMLHTETVVDSILNAKPDVLVWMYNPENILTFDIIGQVTRKLVAVAVLVLADSADENLLKQAMLSGARSVMTFPVKPDRLYKEIIRIYDQLESHRNYLNIEASEDSGLLSTSDLSSLDKDTLGTSDLSSLDTDILGTSDLSSVLEEADAEDMREDDLHISDVVHETVTELHKSIEQDDIQDVIGDIDSSGKILAVYSTGSGSGTTLIATNLAVELAQIGHRTLLIDADLPFGDVSVLLNLRAKPSMSTLINRFTLVTDMSRFDEVVQGHHSGLDVLLSPHNMRVSLSLLTRYPSLINEIIYHVEHQYDYIIVDCGNTMNAMTANVLQIATRILYVTVPTLIATNNTRRLLKLLGASGVDTSKVTLILNKHVDDPFVDLAYLPRERIDQFLKTHQIEIAIPLLDEGFLLQSVTKAEPIVQYPDSMTDAFASAIRMMIQQVIRVRDTEDRV